MPKVKDVDNQEALVISDQKNFQLAEAFDTAIQQAKDEITRIDERAEFTIQVLTQAIRTQAAVAKGRVLLQLRERFDQAPELEGKWTALLDDLSISNNTAYQWINSAKVVDTASPIFGDELLLNMSPAALHKIHQLPTEAKLDVLEQAEQTGKAPTVKEVTAVAQKPEVKLDKATEDLIAARARRQAAKEAYDNVREDPEIGSKDPEYKRIQNAADHAERQVQRLEETIEQLRSQIAEDKIKAEQQAKEAERLNSELDLLKYDDTAAREQRVKRVGNTLIVQLPAVLSDVQKYIAEKEHYDTRVVSSLDSSIETLINFLKPLYG